MKVLVIGATGQIGQLLVPRLLAHQHQVTAMVRTPEKANELYDGLDPESTLSTVTASLEDNVETLSQLMREQDAVIFTAGSGASTGLDKTLLIDLDGAVKAMEAAEKSSIQHFLLVSALQAHDRDHWNEAIRPYYAAKHYADRILTNSPLNYTIVRPGRLLNEPGTGHVQMAPNIPDGGAIARADVAEVLAQAVGQPQTYRQAFDLINGQTAIVEAISHWPKA